MEKNPSDDTDNMPQVKHNSYKPSISAMVSIALLAGAKCLALSYWVYENGGLIFVCFQLTSQTYINLLCNRYAQRQGYPISFRTYSEIDRMTMG